MNHSFGYEIMDEINKSEFSVARAACEETLVQMKSRLESIKHVVEQNKDIKFVYVPMSIDDAQKDIYDLVSGDGFIAKEEERLANIESAMKYIKELYDKETESDTKFKY